MGSNIYYSERKLMKEREALSATIVSRLRRALGLSKQESKIGKTITAEKIKSVFEKTTFLGILLHRANIHLNRFELRSKEQWFQDDKKNSIYIPQNIRLSNDIDRADYYVVLIDNDFEIRYWPGARLPFDDPDKMKHYPVTDMEITEQIEESFGVLFAYVHGEKVEGYYEDLQGQKISIEDITNLISAIYPGFDKKAYQNTLAELYKAATDLLGFYNENKDMLRSKGYDVPDRYLFQNRVFDFLLEEKKMVNIDWKADAADINYAVEILSKGQYKDLLCEDTEEDTQELIEKIEEKLLKLNQSLLCIDGGSDEYLFILLPYAQSQAAVQAAKVCGIKILPASKA